MSALRHIGTLVLLLGVMTIMLEDAFAQTAVGGAIVGGAIGGRRGAAIGAATGAALGAHRRAYWRGHYGHWRGHNFYYWSHGSCWVRTTSGRSHPVSHRYCH